MEKMIPKFYGKDEKKIKECNKQAIQAGLKGALIVAPFTYVPIYLLSKRSESIKAFAQMKLSIC